jgi:histidine triad (HIT) family protein
MRPRTSERWLAPPLGSMKNAPAGYQCPFCHLAATLSAPTLEPAIVLVEPRVFAFVPLHHYAGIRGNCLIAPRAHYENALDIPDELGGDFFRATRLIANAMQDALGCEGISTRQHNGPAGNQDVWHYHLHVFPRFHDDGLYGGDAALYGPQERLEVANRLRGALEKHLRTNPS